MTLWGFLRGGMVKINAVWNWNEDLRLADIEFAHAGAQGAALQTQDFSRAVFAADFPAGPVQARV
jgi:hypothetical protein